MIQAWNKQFGNDYTKRNQYDWRLRAPIFKQILKGRDIQNILEVGCNTGQNLEALNSLGYIAFGIEPNATARNMAHDKYLFVFPGTATEIPFKRNDLDLVFTCGVLIHIPPKELKASMKEIIRVSRKYVLAIEYDSLEEAMIEYRGKKNMLWKRPYGKLYKDLGLKLVDSGTAPTIDNSSWWLFEK